ncbi:MAG: endonuclease domain-containing protein [Anaerolineales bacterium]|nr:MAG: endonuclease domain-containing protein [Anaerolineales bacterium]
MIERARELRKQPTKAEAMLWDALRNRQLEGHKFRRQYSIDHYIVDFCCPEHKLVIEVDGEVHIGQEEYDQARTQTLNDFGFRVIRFSNQQVLQQLDRVLHAIRGGLS